MNTPARLPERFLPFDSKEATLETVGGKGASLARLVRAGFNVPGGFFIPTRSYLQFVAEHRLNGIIHDALEGLEFNDPAALQAASHRIRSQFEQASISQDLRDALLVACDWIGAPSVAVRSSATTEDLPDMSFAGQQDTFLNVIGVDALTESIVACWSSLWTARAIGYRARNEIPQESASLSVVVQKMVEAEVSGVMFTANPLSGKRDELVIDATFGLGEALVSGQVEPDNYVVANDRVTTRTLGAKATVIRAEQKGGVSTQRFSLNDGYAQKQALADEEILALARIGQRIAEESGCPQDIEWATSGGELHILQSRPITSLYPLPEGMTPEPFQVMIGFHVVQGVLEPFTPLGMETITTVLTSAASVFGAELNADTQTTFLSAGERIWVNISAILHHPFGRRVYPRAVRAIDPAVGQILEGLIHDPRLAVVRQRPQLHTIFNFLKFVVPFWGRVFRYWWHPETGAERLFSLTNATIAKTRTRSKASGDIWIDFKEHLAVWEEIRCIFPDVVAPHGISAIAAAMVPFFAILQRFSEAVGAPQLYLEIARGLPHNVTTEMDLKLWETAKVIRADAESRLALADTPAYQITTDYQAGSLPKVAQRAVAEFMSRYGMRGLGEIDLGRPRWREEPFHIIQTLQSYLEITDPSLAPDVVFARGAEAAGESGRRLVTKVRSLKCGWLKSRLVRWAISRYRPLAGLREAPKFFAIQMLGIIRQGFLESGKNMVDADLLEHEDDLFFLKVSELYEIGAEKTISTEMREAITERRAARARELRRKRLPRVLLSDGTAFFEGLRATHGDDEDAIFGDPVSPGVVEGSVRVVMSPRETQLLPGEILVCPGTDPAWTPLFLAAGGLVMEVGGLMTHGSVVAREYGIPAVVGVDHATTRLKTGQRVRVDGSSGVIANLDQEEAHDQSTPHHLN